MSYIKCDRSTPDGYLEDLVRGIARNQSAVKIAIGLLQAEREVALVLTVASSDLPRILGT